MGIYNFIKTNWFVISLFALVLMAFVKERQKQPGGSIKSINKTDQRRINPEKYTDATEVKETSAPTTMGFGMEENKNQFSLPEIGDEEAMVFFKRFRKVAEEEQRKYGVPASVTLACAFVNSFAGSRELVKKGHNYFALSCSTIWSGQSVNQNDKCYRAYETAWESYRDFSETVSRLDGYAELKTSGKTKPDVWVEMLVKSGVSEIDDFENNALKAIERYHLFELDKKN
jgi:flagellum-specific peptidoglycan hydrolase FlgJ